jgi:transcriptional regulator with XRE-family HTH domain
VIPPDFWARADVRDALRQRSIGQRLRLLRQWAGLSQTRVATATGIGQGRLSEYARDIHAAMTVKVWERIANGLDMPDAARVIVGLAPLQPTPAAAVPSVAQPTSEIELLQQITTARSIDSAVVRTLQDETDAIRLLDRRLGAPAVAPKLEAHISHIETSLRYSLPPGQRRPLAKVLADAAALAGWQAIDMGHLAVAWDHSERATAAAREAGDFCLQAFAAGEQAYVMLDLQRSHEALEMVRAAYDDTHPRVPHEVRGWLRAAEGEMAAAAGQESVCRRALDLAAHEIGHARATRNCLTSR